MYDWGEIWNWVSLRKDSPWFLNLFFSLNIYMTGLADVIYKIPVTHGSIWARFYSIITPSPSEQTHASVDTSIPLETSAKTEMIALTLPLFALTVLIFPSGRQKQKSDTQKWMKKWMNACMNECKIDITKKNMYLFFNV